MVKIEPVNGKSAQPVEKAAGRTAGGHRHARHGKGGPVMISEEGKKKHVLAQLMICISGQSKSKGR